MKSYILYFSLTICHALSTTHLFKRDRNLVFNGRPIPANLNLIPFADIALTAKVVDGQMTLSPTNRNNIGLLSPSRDHIVTFSSGEKLLVDIQTGKIDLSPLNDDEKFDLVKGYSDNVLNAKENLINMEKIFNEKDLQNFENPQTTPDIFVKLVLTDKTLNYQSVLQQAEQVLEYFQHPLFLAARSQVFIQCKAFLQNDPNGKKLTEAKQDAFVNAWKAQDQNQYNAIISKVEATIKAYNDKFEECNYANNLIAIYIQRVKTNSKPAAPLDMVPDLTTAFRINRKAITAFKASPEGQEYGAKLTALSVSNPTAKSLLNNIWNQE